MRGEDLLLVAILTTMIVLAGTQIVLRNVWDTGIAWVDPLLRVLVLWIGILGAMVATREHRQISIDVLSRFLGPRARNVVCVATDTFAAFICALLAFHGTRFVLTEFDAGSLAFASVPTWACALIIPLGLGIIAVRYFVSAAHRTYELMKYRQWPS